VEFGILVLSLVLPGRHVAEIFVVAPGFILFGLKGFVEVASAGLLAG
jgi:hypothetical protein